MRRLSGTDALFLSMETPAWHQHIGGLVLLDPSDAPGWDFDRACEVLAARVDTIPKLRWRLKEVPLGLDRPVWVRDEHFTLARHVHRVGAPRPGGRREMGELFGQIMSRQLDRTLPLWEYWFIDGLVNDRVATVLKFHHALLDGAAGAVLATMLLDLAPDAPLVREDLVGADDPGRSPSDVELLARSMVPGLRTPERLMRYGARLGRRAVSAVSASRGQDESPAMFGLPRTPWNHDIGPRRSFAFASFDLDDLRAVKTAAEVKLNDVVLAVAGGALRAYLHELDALPGSSLVASVPVSTRAAGDNGLDNQLASMMVSLHTDERDPLARLHAVHHSADTAKNLTAAVRATSIPSLGETFTPAVLQLVFRTLHETHALEHMPVMANLVVSNVAGPPVPLFLAGARMTGTYPGSVILDGMGLNITAVSYAGRLDVGVGVDPELVPDPWRIAELLGDALAELMVATGLGHPTPVEDPFG